MTTDRANEQAIAQMEYIEKLLAAYNMDWDLYSDLRDCDQSDLDEDDLSELQELSEQAADCESEDEALERLQENPLDIQFRSDWQPYASDFTPSEFSILLCTGGPAVRILGELDDNGYPYRAWVEYQDWGIPWTDLGRYQSTALEYARLLIQTY